MLARDAHCDMFTVFLTGFAATLSRYTRQADTLIGTQVTDRTHAELDPLIGLFTNTLTLRMSLADDPTFTELLGRVRDTTADALAHRQLPFEKLVADLAPDRTLAHPPLIQARFDYGSLTPPALDLPGITTRPLAPFTGTAKLDLTVYADAYDAEDTQATRLSMEYSTDLFDAAWADRFLAGMAALLARAADAPGTPVADLPMPMPTTGQRDEPIIERNRQAASAADAASSAAGRVEPRNPVEATLARIWGDLLDPQASVGVHDNLFALGGHSLTVTRLVARLGDAYGVRLPVRQVFASPTIAELAEAVAAHPDFSVAKGPSRHTELDALSDDELDARLRAALAQRNRRRAIADGSER
jgi:non-ribosomal peptide synthetase component F